MPPKAFNKTSVDDILCDLLPKDLSKETKLAIINDSNFKNKNISFGFNYDQLSAVGGTLDVTQDYHRIIIHAKNCLDSLKNVWKD